MRKYLAVPLSVYAGLAAQSALERAEVFWWLSFIAGLVVMLVVLLVVAGRSATP
jgi:hypothetical protein